MSDEIKAEITREEIERAHAEGESMADDVKRRILKMERLCFPDCTPCKADALRAENEKLKAENEQIKVDLAATRECNLIILEDVEALRARVKGLEEIVRGVQWAGEEEFREEDGITRVFKTCPYCGTPNDGSFHGCLLARALEVKP